MCILTIIIAVLESYEVVRRQLLHFKKMKLPKEVEMILVDDGSDPKIEFMPEEMPNNFDMIYTCDKRPWSQPCARNTAAELARGQYYFMTDIDHILSEKSIQAALKFKGDKMMFPRQWGILDRYGRVDQSKDKLFEYGLPPELYKLRKLSAGMHHNTFVMKAEIFHELGGYDEKFCGKYGGDDTDFSNRYSVLCRKEKKVKPHVGGPAIYVYPDPQSDVKKIFHRLRTK